MRLLLANANTSAHVTELMTEAALAVPVPDLMVRGLTPEAGPAIIASRLENEIAAPRLVELVLEHADEADAVLLGVSFDTALRSLKEILPIPVVGMTQASLIAARAVGDRIGVVGLNPRTAPVYRETIAAAGVGAVAAEAYVDLPYAFAPGDRGAVFEHLGGIAADLAEREGLDAVVLLGAVLAGATGALRERMPVPVFDGITAGVLLADMLVRLELPRPAAGAFAPLSGRTITGVSDRLARRAAGETAG